MAHQPGGTTMTPSNLMEAPVSSAIKIFAKDRYQSLQIEPRQRTYLLFRTVLELIAAGIMLVLFAPVIACAGLLVRLTSRGPMFYTQTRSGAGGKPYLIYKLRTMQDKCELRSGPQWAKVNDPRVTPLGHFLRKTHIDELPQLWNVLRMEMSLIGPRPERPEFINGLELALPHYRDRMLVRPGITGLAQILQPADTDLESVRRKLAYDLYYIRHQGFWLDCRILLGTLGYLVRFPYERVRSLVWLPDWVTVESHARCLAGATTLADLQPC